MDNRPLPVALDDNGEWEKPRAARMYDAMLGGFHNTAADRQAVQQAEAIYPDIALVARANRAFLRRAVTYLLEQGIEQFLDLGSGIPTVGNTHEIAQRIKPTARVLYVDNDPLAILHSEALLANNPYAAALQADARDPAAILAHPTTQRLLDLNQPVGVLLLALLHFVTDDTAAYGLVETLRAALPPGSYLAISHATYDGVPAEVIERVEQLYARTANPGKARTGAAIARFFAGLTFVEPGLVPISRWRPDDPHDPFQDEPTRVLGLAGVGRKP